jgi:uncharacterized cupredoxin-like copper-binding protein
MPVPTIRDDPLRAADPDSPVDERIEARLARIEQRVERGNREGRKAGRAFMIFAVAALLLAMVELVAIATKLDNSSTATTVARPAPVAAATATAAPAATVAPTATPAPVVAARHIGVTLREYAVVPSSTVGQAGRVTFKVRNSGAVPHEFVVLRTAKPAADLLKGARADETGNVGETGDLQPGQAKTLSLALKPGHYALICNLPGHYQAGQHADFTVR